jgi:hypothetical protein
MEKAKCKIKHTCICGTAFYDIGYNKPPQKFCSRECSHRYKNRAQPRIPREIRTCGCGCGFKKEVRENSDWEYKSGHNHKGKSYEEMYGQEKANNIRTMRIKGKNHPNWKGGITSLKKKIRSLFQYRQWRSDIFTRDNWTCQECGKRSCYLEAHHLKPIAIIIQKYNINNLEDAILCEELWNINNGQTLCIDCHNKTKDGRRTLND